MENKLMIKFNELQSCLTRLLNEIEDDDEELTMLTINMYKRVQKSKRDLCKFYIGSMQDINTEYKVYTIDGIRYRLFKNINVRLFNKDTSFLYGLQKETEQNNNIWKVISSHGKIKSILLKIKDHQDKQS